MTILVDGGGAVTVNLTPTSPNCKPNPSVPGSYICTASINVSPGNHVFTVTMYDGTGGTGNVLSTNTTGTIFVSPTGTTTVPIVLQGVAQFVALTLATPNPPVGTAATIPLTALVQDADHNLIVGPAVFNNPITLTTTDAVNGALSKTTLNSPADETGLTVKYSGANVASITFSATAAGLTKANVTNAVLTPTPGTKLAATATGALTALLVKGTVYAFVPTSSMSAPSSGGLVEVPVLDSSGILTAGATHPAAVKSATSAMIPAGHVISQLSTKLLQSRGFLSPFGRAHAAVNPILSGTAGVTACSGDQVHLRVYCINNVSANITELDASTVPATVIKSIVTDATTAVGFSGGACLICGVAYDPTDDAAIIGTVNGIEVYSSAGAHVSTTAVNISETFGYNPVTNQVFNPNYAGNRLPGLTTPSIDVVDIKSAQRYTLTPTPTNLSEPDQGAVDSKTNIGLSFEEFEASDNQYYIVPIGAGTFDKATSSFTEAKPVAFPFTSGILSTCSLAADGIAIDSSIDVAFFNAEFCPGTIGAGQMPTSATASPSISSFAFAPLPNTPDGNPFLSGFDPHTQTVIFGSFGDYGLSFNSDYTYLALTDLKKLLAAPRSGADPTLVNPTYDLLANKVVTYIPI